MSQTAEQAYAALIGRVKECRLLGSCAEVLGWDEQTYMPPRGSAHRAEQMALLARMTHDLLTAPAVGELLGQAEALGLAADEVVRANLRGAQKPKLLRTPSFDSSRGTQPARVPPDVGLPADANSTALANVQSICRARPQIHP